MTLVHRFASAFAILLMFTLLNTFALAHVPKIGKKYYVVDWVNSKPL